MGTVRKKVAFAAAVAAFAVAGCGSDDDGGGESAAAGGGENAEFRIGAGLALTGGFAAFDQPAKAGIELGIKEINDRGGLLGKHKIVLDVKDMRSDPAQAVIGTKALLEDDPNLIVAACMTDAAIPQGRLAQEAKIPAFSTCATSPTLTTSVGDFMFGNFPADNFEGTAAAQYAREQGYETAFLIESADTAYTANIPKFFGEAFEAAGGTVVGKASFSLSQQDFSPLVTKIKTLSPQPDVIETGMFEPAFPAFMKQLRAAGVETPVLGAGGIDTPSVAAGGKPMDGVVFASQGFAEDGNELAEFNAKIEQAAGASNVTSYAARGYDLTRIIEAAVDAAGSIEPQKVRDAIMTLKDVQGVSTTSTYDYPGANGLPLINPIFFVKLQGGEKELVEKIDVDPAAVPKPQG